MDVKYGFKKPKEIKLPLVFFCLTLIIACGRGDQVHINGLDYENERVVGVNFTTDIDVEQLRVFIGAESQTSVIGLIVSEKGKHNFAPVVPFTPGQTYTLRQKNTEVLASFVIPEREGSEDVELLAIHPQLDTVPENLLKMYFEFAQPMQEVGNALDFIKVTNDSDGLETQPFLRLESELWNRERTLLTLWLDPGRIKTDLIPNREKGLPLTKSKRYTVAIDSSWKSAQGRPLEKGYSKNFHVGPRDDAQPDMKHWQLRMPAEDSLQSLYLDFKEPMDSFLARETIRFYDLEGTEIKGQFKLLDNQSVLRFVPNRPWAGPDIEIRVESRLEDLAGNNLERRFDNPILDGKASETDNRKIRSLKYKLRD